MKIKKPKRRTLIISSIVFGALIAAAGGVLIKIRSEQSQMNAVQTGEFLPGIYAINTGFVSMFLIDCGGSYIAVDAGGNSGAVEQGLSQLGISGEDVAQVLMTHTHGDHTAGLGLFGAATVYGAKGGAGVHTVSDGDSLEINGRTVEVIGTPGHADDSVCYLLDGLYLFAGDNLSIKDGKVGMFISIYNKSDEQQKADIDRLAGLGGFRYVITAHYGYADSPAFP
ncbi:MAG: MBL fold metallo-hydrolase [Oscillospiraceae bacterium]|nr:MBL fold metallo-hydrolase [Oscillospiraceae bacterium]